MYIVLLVWVYIVFHWSTSGWMGGVDGENHAALYNWKHAMMGWEMNTSGFWINFEWACITRQMWVFLDCANIGVHSLGSSSHYRRPHIHPLLYLTACIHTRCWTRDVQKPGKTEIFGPKSEIFVSDLSSPCCIGCQSIFEPGGAGSPFLCSRMILEQGLSVPTII